MIHILKWVSLMSFLCGLMGCNRIEEATGSFEESPESGRLNVKIDGNYRFFRFHLRQFDTDIGGTFETFDLPSFKAFSQMPLIMDKANEDYYCSRIDYGYVRNQDVRIVFTDREQRQWIIDTKLGDERLHGSMLRTKFNHASMMTLHDLDYLLPEDVEYYQAHALDVDDETTVDQMILTQMDKKSDKPLNCIYYQKKSTYRFKLPEALDLSSLCEPSVSQCDNLRLAIVGMPWVRNLSEAYSMKEIFSARLDDCDIDDGMRTVYFRDNPFALLKMDTQSFFVATAFVYIDEDLNGSWNKLQEPVIAALNNQYFVFYDDSDDDDVFHSIFQSEQFSQGPQWYAFTNDVENLLLYDLTSHDSEASFHLISKATSVTGDELTLFDIHLDDLDNLGCYFTSDEDQVQCSGIMPVMLQD